jgi:hypothetical protein
LISSQAMVDAKFNAEIRNLVDEKDDLEDELAM